jgi:hypothetical protein
MQPGTMRDEIVEALRAAFPGADNWCHAAIGVSSFFRRKMN